LLRVLMNVAVVLMTLWTGSGASTAAVSLPSQLSPIAAKPSAPDFTLPRYEGGPVTLSNLHGKVVVLNFWATWCPPCREEMPSMQTLWESLQGEDFELIAVNVGEDEDLVFAFRNEISKSLGFPILLDNNSEAAGRYPIRGLPTTYILDKQGRIVYQAIGGRDWSAPGILKTIRDLLRQ